MDFWVKFKDIIPQSVVDEAKQKGFTSKGKIKAGIKDGSMRRNVKGFGEAYENKVRNELISLAENTSVLTSEKIWDLIVGSALTVVAIILIFWAFSKPKLESHHYFILKFVFPLVAGFVVRSYAGVISVKAHGFIPGVIIVSTSSFSVFLIMFFFLKEPSQGPSEPDPAKNCLPSATIAEGDVMEGEEKRIQWITSEKDDLRTIRDGILKQKLADSERKRNEGFDSHVAVYESKRIQDSCHSFTVVSTTYRKSNPKGNQIHAYLLKSGNHIVSLKSDVTENKDIHVSVDKPEAGDVLLIIAWVWAEAGQLGSPRELSFKVQKNESE